MSFKIEKKVAMPAGYSNGIPIWPFSKMSIGDSFVITDVVLSSRIRSSASTYGRRHDMKFSVRVDRNDGSMRCWRTA